MTPDSVLTSDPNLLQTTKFRLMFTRLPNVEYFLVDVNIPGVMLPAVPRTSPFRDMPIPGDKLEWEELDLVFNVDENLQNWKEIFNWMNGLGKPLDFNQYKSLKNKSNVYSDASLIIMSSHNNAQFRVVFSDCWPTRLSGVKFSAAGSADQPIIGQATFNYTYYTLENIN